MKMRLVSDKEYRILLSNIKVRVRTAQIKATVSVNTEMLKMYWALGRDIVEKQNKSKWGDGLLPQLSKDLMAEFPNVKGFSISNLKYIKQWFIFYSSVSVISQQPVGELKKNVFSSIMQIPWGHNIAIIAKCKNAKEALFYVENTITHNWSRSVLVHQVESGLYKRQGKSVTNFSLTLPKAHSDLAEQTIKDPYIFDFMTMTKPYGELDLENALVAHVTQFLLELGAGFSFIGKQVPIKVGTQEFFIDLLFYHARLHCYVVIELKTKAFEPGHVGQLNFYVKAVDMQLRKEGDQPTIGLLLCKNRDKLVAEYSLSDIHKPMGVSEYKLKHSLPKKLKASLPAIEEIEKEFSKMVDKGKK